MGIETGIAWTDHTYNPWYGCTHVSPGCDNCYMYAEQRRYGNDPEIVKRARPHTFNAPLKWKSGRVFTCSWSDFFISDADAWRDEAWDIIRRTPHLTYQILTKRPVLIKSRLPKDWGAGYPNVWLGVSVENQEMTSRIDVLLKVPAAKYFISVEPLLEAIDLKPWLWMVSTSSCRYETRQSMGLPAIGWAILGGESGHGARIYHEDWEHSLIDQLADADVPTFNKQKGSHSHVIRFGREICLKAGGSCGAGDWNRTLVLNARKGDDPREWPMWSRVREFPR